MTAIDASGLEHRHGRAVLLTAWLATLAVTLTLTAAAAAAEPPSFTRARQLLMSQPKAGAAMLDELARLGDRKSQLLLGALLLYGGEQVPQDRPLGLAYVQLAAANPYPVFGKPIGEKAQSLMRQAQLTMAPAELLKADQLAGSIVAAQDRMVVSGIRSALLHFTDQPVVELRPLVRFAAEPVQIRVTPPTEDRAIHRVGCAAEHGPGCDGAPAPPGEGHCTGRLLWADASARFNGPDARTVQPEYPQGARRDGGEGTVFLLAHVDSSGCVCSALLVHSAGDSRLDSAALDSLRQWRFVPATKSDAPIESLHPIQITFSLSL